MHRKSGGIRLIHKKNGGVSSARNLGIEIAKGDYIAFVDADDFAHPDFIKILVEAIEQWNCEIAVCSLKNIYSSDEANEKMEAVDTCRSEMVIGSDIYKRTRAMCGIESIEEQL